VAHEHLTNRQKQALETKEKVYKVAMEKFVEKGLDETSISEICKEAKVSVGSFYNHFADKEAIIYETFQRADLNFEKFLNYETSQSSIKEFIYDYMDYYMGFVLSYDFEFIKRFYNTSNLFFVQKNRPMQGVLIEVLEKIQVKLDPYFAQDCQELVEMLFMSARGTIFHWCLKQGGFDLQEVNRKQMEIILDRVLMEEHPSSV